MEIKKIIGAVHFDYSYSKLDGQETLEHQLLRQCWDNYLQQQAVLDGRVLFYFSAFNFTEDLTKYSPQALDREYRRREFLPELFDDRMILFENPHLPERGELLTFFEEKDLRLADKTGGVFLGEFFDVCVATRGKRITRVLDLDSFLVTYPKELSLLRASN